MQDAITVSAMAVDGYWASSDCSPGYLEPFSGFSFLVLLDNVVEAVFGMSSEGLVFGLATSWDAGDCGCCS